MKTAGIKFGGHAAEGSESPKLLNYLGDDDRTLRGRFSHGRGRRRISRRYDNASVPVCEDSMRGAALDLLGRVRRWSLHLGHILRRRRSIRRSPGLLWRILGGTFCLQLFCVEDAIASEAAIGQSLRIIFESIRRGFRAGVIHCEVLVLFDQDKLHMRSSAVDGARLNIAGHAQAFRVRAIAHLVQFLDGDIVAFAVLHAGVCKIAEQQQDKYRRATKLQIRLGLTGHICPRRESPYLESTHPEAGNQDDRKGHAR